jgi:hypothetical protein
MFDPSHPSEALIKGSLPKLLSCCSELSIRVAYLSRRSESWIGVTGTRPGNRFVVELGYFFGDDGGEMSCGDGLMLGAGPSRGWWRETTRGKPGARCAACCAMRACQLRGKQLLFWCIF